MVYLLTLLLLLYLLREKGEERKGDTERRKKGTERERDCMRRRNGRVGRVRWLGGQM